jgi:hypothetical protein
MPEHAMSFTIGVAKRIRRIHVHQCGRKVRFQPAFLNFTDDFSLRHFVCGMKIKQRLSVKRRIKEA